MLPLLHGTIPAPGEVWSAWNWDPWILSALGVFVWLYLRGVKRLWWRAGRGAAVSPRRVYACLGGVYVLFIALVSPLDALGGALFSAHMVQHLLLMLVAGPLIAFGAPLVPLLWAIPLRWRVWLGRVWKQSGGRASWTLLSHPLAVWALYAAALWLWHLPGPYDAALDSDLLHALEHASFFGTAMLFWWTLLHAGTRGARVYGVAVLFVFATAAQSGILGAMITLARAPWYRGHSEGAALWGRPLLEDQQLAGAIMWIPPSILYGATAVFLFGAWLDAIERRRARHDARHDGFSGDQPRADQLTGRRSQSM